jgi:hypothetical protein
MAKVDSAFFIAMCRVTGVLAESKLRMLVKRKAKVCADLAKSP